MTLNDNTSPINSEDLKALILVALEEKKAESITVIELKNKTSLTDYMIFVSGRSTKNVAAIADFVAQEIKTKTDLSVAIDGLGNSEWVILDAGSVIVHLFHPEARMHYRLEEKWGGATPAPRAGQ